MKFILKSDRLFLRGEKNINSGSLNYYEIPVEFDSKWENLSVKAILIKKGETNGEEVAVINQKFYIDRKKSGEYKVGFIGYTIENEEKTLQVSTNLIAINIEQGAGEINIIDTHEMPTPSEWEVYISQIQEITNTINGLSENLKAKVVEVETKLENGDFNGEDGQDGFSPSITIEQIDNGVKINILDKDGMTSAILNNGEQGEKGDPGTNGKDGKDGENGIDGITPTIGTNGNWYLGEEDTGKPSRGEKGEQGIPGEDYILTTEDKQEIAEIVLNEIPDGDEVSY